MKAFSVEQKEEIRASLIKNCLHCWGVFGFSKTSVSQLCEMSGVSVGVFYQIFDSKERLFYDSAQEYELGMFRVLESHIAQKPNKEGFLEGIIATIKMAMESVWFYQINNDLQKISRKISLDMKKETENIFFKLYVPLFEKYNLKSKKSWEETLSIITLLYSGILFVDVFPMDVTKCIEFIAESTINNLLV